MKLTFLADDEALGGIILSFCGPSFNTIGLETNEVTGLCDFIAIGDLLFFYWFLTNDKPPFFDFDLEFLTEFGAFD